VYQVSWIADGALISASGMVSLLPYVFSSNLITRRCPCDPSEVNPIDRSVIGNSNPFLDSVSDVTVGAAVVAPILLDWQELGASQPFAEDLLVYSEVLSVNGALVSLAKYAAQRPLPRVYADPHSELASRAGGFRSFYSGHVSLAVSALTATAMTDRLRHGGSSWPWIITAGIGTSVMIERVAAGRHFYSDVIYGALAGLGVGTLIPLLHARARDSGSDFKPLATAEHLGLAWNLHF